MKLYPIIILAGGLATRLHPITEKIPKALVKVGGSPFIVHQLNLLKSRGLENIVISAWYKGEMIQDFLGNGNQFGVDIQYIFDGDRPLGTGGAIRKALKLMDSPFFVLYGDSYLPCNYKEIQSHFDENNKPALMTIYHNAGKWDTSNVEMENRQIIRYDKKDRHPRMQFIDYGLGLFQLNVFSSLDEDTPIDLADLYKKLAESRKLLAYEVKQRFYEIGSFDGLHELDRLLDSDPNQFLQEE